MHVVRVVARRGGRHGCRDANLVKSERTDASRWLSRYEHCRARSEPGPRIELPAPPCGLPHRHPLSASEPNTTTRARDFEVFVATRTGAESHTCSHSWRMNDDEKPHPSSSVACSNIASRSPSSMGTGVLVDVARTIGMAIRPGVITDLLRLLRKDGLDDVDCGEDVASASASCHPTWAGETRRRFLVWSQLSSG